MLEENFKALKLAALARSALPQLLRRFSPALINELNAQLDATSAYHVMASTVNFMTTNEVKDSATVKGFVGDCSVAQIFGASEKMELQL